MFDDDWKKTNVLCPTDESDLTIDDAPFSVDELVSDDDHNLRMADPFNFASRSSTPAVPPGFGPPGSSLAKMGHPHAHPEFLAPEEPTPKSLSKIAPNAPVFIPSAPTALANSSLPPTPTKGPRTPKGFQTSQAKQELKSLASSSGLSKAIASHSSAKVNLKSEEFPALESNKSKNALTGTGKVAPSTKKSTSSPSTTKALNVKKAPNPTLTPSLFPALPPSTPLARSTQLLPSRPTVNTGKVSKALPTPKAETPTTGATPSSAVSNPPNYQSSQQPSLASIAKLERPGTPTSEIISDNASTTSISISRANSPPPSKIGSAPVRLTTKSMQKKQRQQQKEKATQLEFEAAATKTEHELEIAPVVGRKKKQKKDKIIRALAGVSTPVASRPSSPGPLSAESKPEVAVMEEQTVTPIASQEEKDVLQSPIKSADVKGKGKSSKPLRPASPEPVAESEDPPERPNPTISSILRELQRSGDINDINASLFKPINTGSRYQDAQTDQLKPHAKLVITEEDRATLLAGQPVRKIIDGQRVLMTPNGNCVRNLTFEEEERYLELQSNIARETGPTAFVSGNSNSKNRFTLIGGRAVPNGPPSYLPQPFALNTDAVSRIQHEEALSYINQYVLPYISANPQLEKKLNFDAEEMRSGSSLFWDGSSGHHSDDRKDANVHEGIFEDVLSGNPSDRSPTSNVPMLGTSEAEQQLQTLRKETDGLEKRLQALMKKNKKALSGP